MEFLRNGAQWRKWARLHGSKAAVFPPTRYPCAAMILAAGDGKRVASADYLYREDVSELAAKFEKQPEDENLAEQNQCVPRRGENR